VKQLALQLRLPKLTQQELTQQELTGLLAGVSREAMKTGMEFASDGERHRCNRAWSAANVVAPGPLAITTRVATSFPRQRSGAITEIRFRANGIVFQTGAQIDDKKPLQSSRRGWPNSRQIR
jgi:hypothetical protein